MFSKRQRMWKNSWSAADTAIGRKVALAASSIGAGLALSTGLREAGFSNRPEQTRRLAARALVGQTVADVERELILGTLEHFAGNRTHAARQLGISVRTLRNKVNEYEAAGVDVPAPGGRGERGLPADAGLTSLIAGLTGGLAPAEALSSR